MPTTPRRRPLLAARRGGPSSRPWPAPPFTQCRPAPAGERAVRPGRGPALGPRARRRYITPGPRTTGWDDPRGGLYSPTPTEHPVGRETRKPSGGEGEARRSEEVCVSPARRSRAAPESPAAALPDVRREPATGPASTLGDRPRVPTYRRPPPLTCALPTSHARPLPEEQPSTPCLHPWAPTSRGGRSASRSRRGTSTVPRFSPRSERRPPPIAP